MLQKLETAEEQMAVILHVHVWEEEIVLVPATCTEPGTIQYRCQCGETETHTIPPAGHTLAMVDAVIQGCETDGNIAYWHCSVCGKDYLNEDGTGELTAEQITIPASGHIWDEGVITKEATPEEPGEKTFTCENCGKTKKETFDYVAPTVIHDHAFAGNQTLETFTVGASITEIEDEAFAGCGNLKEIYFEGDMPVFGEDVFKDISEDAVFYYPEDNQTWSETALQAAGINVRTAPWNPATGDVVERDLSDCVVTLEYQETVYDGKQKKPSVTVKDGQMVLKENKDYTVTYADNIEPGTGVVNVIGLDHYKGSAQATFLIAKAQVTEKKDNVIKAADLTVKGTGKAQKVFVKATALGGARLSYKSDRAGAGITGNGTLTIPATFAGKITVMVNAAETAEYKGASKKVSVIVLPKSMQLSKVKASGSRKAKVTWKKNETAQGYELQCATNKSFTKNVKTLTVTKQNTKKKTVKKLKGGKKYYFRIRAFITINGTKYYSDWSKAKKAKIKK